jgi:carboxyl-terminal processing protease
MKLLKRFAAIAAVAAVALGSAAPVSAMTFLYGDTPIDLRMDALQEMIEEIRENYKDETDLDEMFTGIYKGLFSSLGDPWSAYITPESTDGLNLTTNNVEEAYEGIGVLIRKTELYGMMVSSVVSGSPAYKAGIRSGDVILKVGPQDVDGMTVSEVAALIRGTSGSTVTLTVDRDGKTLVFEVVRQVIRTDSVSGELRGDGIAVIRITSFTGGTAAAFAELYDGFAAQGAKGVILDLRGNPGGVIDEAISVADHLIHTDGRISEFVRQDEVIETVYSSADSYADLPVVCLTDGETASASELLAAALKGRKEATVVGEKTFGKGVAQFIGSGAHDDIFKLSIYYFLAPDGSAIDGAGVLPDVAVYAAGGLSAEELDAVLKSLAPMNETKKYYTGESGLNVYAAQQRLQKMGYDVEPTSIMDEKTIAVLKTVQAEAGACPYGGLDYCTLGIIRDKFDAWCRPAGEDAAMAKAIELLQ